MILRTIARNFWFALPAILWVWCCAGSVERKESASADKNQKAGPGDERDSSEEDGSEQEPRANQTLRLHPSLWDGSGRASRAPAPTKVPVRPKNASLVLTGWPKFDGSGLDRLVASSQCVAAELAMVAPSVRCHAPPARA
jgi:hypothetical protein